MKTLKLSFLENVQQILEVYDQGTGFYCIADFILQNKNNKNIWNNKLSIFSLAEMTNTSGPTVTRFSQKLGLSGYKELLVIMRIDDEAVKTEKESYKDYYFNITNYTWLYKTIKHDNKENIFVLNKLYYYSGRKKRIFFFGSKENIFLVQALVSLVESSGFQVVLVPFNQDQETYVAQLTPNDLAIVIALTLDGAWFNQLFTNLNDVNVMTIIISKQWNNNEVQKIKHKYFIKLASFEDQAFERSGSEISIIFYLKLILIALAKPKRQGA